MNFALMPAEMPGEGDNTCQYLSTCVVNRTVALDAGSLGFLGTPENQAAIDHIFLSHTHLDHIASLPIFLENVYDLRATPPVIHGSREVLESLQRDMFNDRLWPDFIAISRQTRPFLRLVHFEPGQTVSVAGLQITAVALSHAVPTVGYLLTDHHGTVAFVPDTGPTEEIWRRAAARSDLQAVVVETTFPNEMAWLAEVSRHLTPNLLAGELAKIGRHVPTFIMHLKARYRNTVREQLHQLKMPHLTILEPGKVVSF